jgi:glycosyltransferase involved in cell wall biosynthesis
MRIAIDARELCGRPTGVGRYLAGLLSAWAVSDAARRHQWTLVAPEPPRGADHWNASIIVAGGDGGTAWEQFTLPSAIRRERPDVFFAPGYTAPLTVSAPLVLTIHDVSFFAHPEWFSVREGLRRRWLTAWSARRARAVITDTEFSRAEITRHIGITDSLRVIPLGLAANDRPNERPSDRSPVVLYVGSVFERRRVDRLIAAFDLVAARVPGARLEIVGENRTRHPRIDLEALRLRTSHPDRITIRSYVDDVTLAQLYRDASVFAFLSEYEGFGLTPLEALVEGVPPVVLDTAVARETCGDAARYVGAGAGNDDIANALVEMLTDATARRRVLDHAGAVLARYDWHRAAAQTLAVLEEAAVGR